MVGYLKIDGERFCVEYADRHIQVFWCPGAAEAAAKAKRWIEESALGIEKVPETMLRVLIGCEVEFVSAPIRKERAAERHGKLSDGGSIKLVYFKLEPLNDDDYRDAVESWRHG
jgi:hypothetical protein